MKNQMPKIDLIQALRDSRDSAPAGKHIEWPEIVQLVIKSNGDIRASKPRVDKGDIISGKAAYVWRLVVFQVSKIRAHQCMPVCSDFDLPAYDANGKWSCSIAREMAKELDPLIDILVHAVPVTQWHGIHRWGRALGY
jgi:hypothetical protein